MLVVLSWETIHIIGNIVIKESVKMSQSNYLQLAVINTHVSVVKVIISSSNNYYAYSYPELSLLAAFCVRSLGDKDRYYWESPILHTLTCLLFTCWHFKLMCAFYRERLNCIHSFCGERPDKKKPVLTMPREIKLFNCFTSSLLTGWPNV
jgi:hypothetical protein